MTDGLVQYATADQVATITLSSTANRNALSPELREQLITFLHAAITAPDARVLVLTHTGPAFSSGMDLRETEQRGTPEPGLRELVRILQLIARSPLPVVARVAGATRAGGVGLLAAADIAIASLDSTFAFTEVRLGLVPAVISVPVLRRVPQVQARELMLTGEVFDARRAEHIGLLNAAVPVDELDAAVERVVTGLRRGAPQALARTKQLLSPGLSGDVDRHYAELVAESVRGYDASEALEGLRARREKRSPAWVSESLR